MRANSSERGPGTELHRAVDGLLEAEAGLDADGQEVEDVRQLALHGLLALLHPAVQHRVGPEGQRRGAEAQAGPGGGCHRRAAKAVTMMNQNGMATTVMTRMARKRSTPSAADAAGVDELLADVVDVADRGEAPAEAGEAAEDGHEGPLVERDQQLLVPDVLDLVALELAQRGADDGLLLGVAEQRVDDEADDAGDQRRGRGYEQHRSGLSDLDLDDLLHPPEAEAEQDGRRRSA